MVTTGGAFVSWDSDAGVGAAGDRGRPACRERGETGGKMAAFVLLFSPRLQLFATFQIQTMEEKLKSANVQSRGSESLLNRKYQDLSARVQEKDATIKRLEIQLEKQVGREWNFPTQLPFSSSLGSAK